MGFEPQAALITGGGTGIGRGLAEALHARGTRVIIAGRRKSVLDDVCRAHPGMQPCVLDVASAQSIAQARDAVLAANPGLDCVINNAGMQRPHDLSSAQPLALDFADDEIAINIRGLFMMCAAFLPHLMRRESASLINISSGLAFVPLAGVPVYCATKAAVRSFTQSLRHQLTGSSVRVIEIAPPAVSTDLHDYMGPEGKNVGIPLADFVAEAMQGLDAGDEDFCVARAKTMQQVVNGESFARAFAAMNARRE